MTDTQTTVTINSQGRVVLPAHLRRELGLTPGSELIAYLEDGRIVLETREHALRRVQAYVTSRVPAGVSLVGELIAERRADAAKEATEDAAT
jgi:AbrB family looped-hinge helix DNA binding protein